jgi:hypothetical protein
MHPYRLVALSRADDAAGAIAADAHDPQLAFIAEGTDLLGLIKAATIRQATTMIVDRPGNLLLVLTRTRKWKQ